MAEDCNTSYLNAKNVKLEIPLTCLNTIACENLETILQLIDNRLCSAETSDYIVVAEEASGANCQYGGVRIETYDGSTNTITSTQYICNTPTYDSGWKEIPAYTVLNGYGLADIANEPEPLHLRIVDRVVTIKGTLILPLSYKGNGSDLVPDYAQYINEYALHVLSAITEGGFTKLVSNKMESVSPVLPATLRPDRDSYMHSNSQKIFRLIDLGVGDLDYYMAKALIPSMKFTTEGKIQIETYESRSLLSDIPTDLIKECTIANEGEYIPDLAGYSAGFKSFSSGLLTIGKKYKIKNFVAGDDFTNLGAASNTNGIVFIATGNTPTVWANLSEIIEFPDETLERTDKFNFTTDTRDGYFLGGYVVPVDFSYHLDKATTIDDIKTAFNSL